MDKFTVKIVGIGINETEKEKAFNDCFGAWITKYRNARVFTKGIMDAHQECEDIHTEWMKYEKMRYELLDDAFK
ncbi:MAG: hypothetical protein H8E17_13055 [Deltaproteobacteria bacterium]|nr:hypothetical protein [Deltaproteobacteria bacterium]